MKQKTILFYGIAILTVVFVVQLFIGKKEGFAITVKAGAPSGPCGANKAKCIYGMGSGTPTTYCIDKGEYRDTSGYFPDFANSRIVAPPGLTVQAYYNQDFSAPTWKVNPGSFYQDNVAPYSLKVF